MKCCNILAGYTLSETDRVRKILGKMLYDKMKDERQIFIEGCKKTNGISESDSNAIFDDFEKAGVYVYNKSHGYAYAMIAYWTGYVKHYYPREFMTALYQTNSKASTVYTRECKRLGIPIAGPDVNESEASFALTKSGIIRYGLSSVKFLASGSHLVQDLRPFSSIEDLVTRIPKKSLNKRAAISLIRVGAMDSIVDHESEWYKPLETDTWNALYQYWKARKDWAKMDHSTGVGDRTQFMDYADEIRVDDRLLAESEILGTLVTVDPLGPYAALILSEDNFPGEGQMLTGEVCRVGGVISRVSKLVTKKGKSPGATMCQFWLETPSSAVSIDSESGGDEDDSEEVQRDDSVQIVAFPGAYVKFGLKIEAGAPVLIDVEKLQSGGLSLKAVFRLDEMGS